MPARTACSRSGPEEPPAFSDFEALSSYLEGLGLFRMLPGLDRMRAALERLGLRRPPYRVAQVVGTNGKGSTATMLATLAKEHGLCAGLHTSPHFLSVRERVLLNGTPLPDELWRGLGNTLMRHGGDELSYFEFVTCLAVLAFAEAGVDIAVMETGLGGSYDATTALDADMLVFTPIGLDHQFVLGPSLEAIAADKAGAIRPGVPVFTAAQRPEVMDRLLKVSRERCAPLHEVPPLTELPDQSRYPLRLEGDHQHENARLALTAWRHIRDAGSFSETGRRSMAAALSEFGPDTLEGQALARAWLPGRFQRIPPRPAVAHAREAANAAERHDLYAPCALGWPPLLLDGAHNAHGLAALGRSLACRQIAPSAVIFACLADKDPQRLVPHLRALATGPVFVPPIADNPRSVPPAELAAAIGLNAVPVCSLTEALEAASAFMADRLPETFAEHRPCNPLLICGSLYLLGEFYALRPDCLR